MWILICLAWRKNGIRVISRGRWQLSPLEGLLVQRSKSELHQPHRYSDKAAGTGFPLPISSSTACYLMMAHQRWPQAPQNNKPCPCPVLAYLVHQVLLRYFNGVLLGPKAVALVCHLLSHQLLQYEEQQIIVISPEGEIPGKSL